MKKLWMILPLLLLLNACGEIPVSPAAPAFEAVEEDAAPDLARPYSVIVAVPPEAEEVFSDEAGGIRRYEEPDGKYEIAVDVFAAEDFPAALERIAGKHDVTAVSATRFSLPEYRLAWEDDDAVCHADVIRDGDRYYAVTLSVARSAAVDYATLPTELFSTVGLFYDEGA